MHEPQLSIAAMPQPPKLFGVQLLPYSLGHELHLYRRASPFFEKEYNEFAALPRSVKLPAAMQAIEVCSRDYAGNLRPPENWWLWSKMCDWFNLDKTVESLWRHIQEAHGGFEADLPSTEGMTTRMIGAPHVLRLYQFALDRVPKHELQFYSNAKRPTAWDFPFSLVTMMAQADAEQKGELSIFNYMNKLLKDHADRRDKEKENEELEYEAYVASERAKCQAL